MIPTITKRRPRNHLIMTTWLPTDYQHDSIMLLCCQSVTVKLLKKYRCITRGRLTVTKLSLEVTKGRPRNYHIATARLPTGCQTVAEGLTGFSMPESRKASSAPNRSPNFALHKVHPNRDPPSSNLGTWSRKANMPTTAGHGQP